MEFNVEMSNKLIKQTNFLSGLVSIIWKGKWFILAVVIAAISYLCIT